MEFKYSSHTINLEDSKGRMLAEISFPTFDENTFVITHTYVDPSLRGQKVAEELVKSVVEKARSEGAKIIPRCSYALREFERKAEYADVWER